uniref:Phosphatidylinositol-3-phosphatase SAC1 n=1 Tax=Acrobeloides nanus TaxID=290746 RepID=A0A914C120_9BILA
MSSTADVYERFNLYSLPDTFYLEPRDKYGVVASNTYLEIDRNLGDVNIRRSTDFPIPVVEAEVQPIYGIVGVIRLVSGNYLIVIKRAELVGTINNSEIYHITETDIIPYKKTTLHLTERQAWFNRHFLEMIHLVLATGGFYYSTTFDLTHSLQWLSESATPTFKQLPMIERANPRFVWNRHLCAPFSSSVELSRYALPIMHGFVGIRSCIIRGSSFKLALISRRSIHRAGVRFYMRGTDSMGHSANFIETEQILEFEKSGGKPGKKALTSFIQMRGSIPLYWSQKPNLRWQPLPTMKPADDQLDAYVRHMRLQHQIYGGKHVIVNLVNTKGREKRIGGELERVIHVANLDFARYVGFDFHREVQSLNWDRLSILKDMLAPELVDFGFFYSAIDNPSDVRFQLGFFRTNCMDCLDRTNVVQAMLAKESLRNQLFFLGIIDNPNLDLDVLEDFSYIFKNLWADNGDECSKQYAGTGALKTDFTRIGKRTMNGAINDGINAVTRYFKNNFADGYRQDAIDLFLGNFKVDPNALPERFDTSVFRLDATGGAIIGAIFSTAMVILCLLIS